ncbi:uncharacterized protein LOC110893386 [Helianthus annuus]|uniref:uncharacterized protein LOC110893386 n=1 Tax=Helianthus annuus TaxID=4232 RepID=UPI000B9060E7|nr:uncharacterized protein LOC110893386 [Helianthus annuus]
MDELTKTGGRPPLSFKEIADRILDVDGNNIQPKRGINIIDELTKVSAPVQLDNLSSPITGFHGLNLSADKESTKSSGAANPLAGNSNSRFSGAAEPLSFAKVVNNAKENVKVNFRMMESSESVDGADVVIPMSSVKQVSDRYANTLYGYFLGKRLAFPVVDYFAKNNWVKYGLSRLMMNANGFFFFKFKTKEGMDKMVEDGPWMIRNVPIILKEWSASVKLEKEDIKAIPVWVKMHDVPLTAYTEDGLSLLASKIGVPKMLDSYTATMCAESWGRSSYARALIEIQAGDELKRSITVAIPSLDGNGHSKVEVKIEYDWEPLRCSSCCVFGHEDSSCPKNHQVVSSGDSGKKIDDFQVVGAKKKKATNQGLHMKNQKPKVVYRPVVNPKPNSSLRKPMNNQVSTSNSFDTLKDNDGGQGCSTVGRIEKKVKQANDKQDSDEEEVEEVYNETNKFMTSGTHPSSSRARASNSSTKGSNG